MGRGHGTTTATGRSIAILITAVMLLVTVVSIGDAPSSAVGDPPPDGYVGITPHRVLDTREGVGADRGTLGAGETMDVRVTGVGGVPTADVDTVVVNVAVANPTERSYVTIWPGGVERPTAANLNMVAGQTFANLVFVKVGQGADDGVISIYNDAGETHVIADIVGYVPTDIGFVGITPTRVLDTRTETGEFAGPRGPGSLTLVDAVRRAGIPADANVRSVVLNVTAVTPTEKSFITAFEFGLGQPLSANLNMLPGQTIPNLVIQNVDDEGRLWLYNDAGDTHLVADLVGYFTTGAPYFGLEPTRLLDTRFGPGQPEPRVLGPGETLELDLSGIGGLLTWPGSVALNVTAVQPTARGYLTVWPDGDRPHTASLNFAPGDNMANLVVSEVGDDGRIRIYNSHGSTHVVADLLGWFADAEPSEDGACHRRTADTTMMPLASTEHFAGWWGGEAPDPDRLALAAERALTDMELARTNAVETLGLPEAPGNPLVCANVYFGETGGSFDEAGPGVGTDADGFPFMVMPRTVVDGFADTPPAANVPGVEYTQHEAFHLFQYTSPFVYGYETSAWIEGTADWFTRYTYPTDQGGRYPAAAYLRYPHDPMWSSLESLPADADKNDTRGAHAYGVSWFFYFLTGYEGVDPLALTEGFSGSDPDPWDTFADSLDRRAVDLPAKFGTFAARNATNDWDPADAAAIDDGHNYHDTFDGPDFRIAATHPSAGTGGLTEVPADLVPAGYAWNTIRVTANSNATYRVSFDGDEAGSEGTPSRFEVHAVVLSGSTRTYTRLGLDAGRSGSVDVPAAAGDDVFLVVASVPDRLDGNETYGYRYGISTL